MWRSRVFVEGRTQVEPPVIVLFSVSSIGKVERPNSLSGEYSGFSTSEECGEHRETDRILNKWYQSAGYGDSRIHRVNVKGRRKRRLLEVDEDDVGSGGTNVHSERSNRICWFVVCETMCRSKVIYVETRVIVCCVPSFSSEDMKAERSSSSSQLLIYSSPSQREAVMAGKSYSAKVKRELKLAGSQRMYIVFAKDDQGSGLVSDCVLIRFQDSSERKLQRSMTVRSAGSVTRVNYQILVDMRSSGSDDQSYQKIRNRAGSNKGCYKLKSAGMSQVMVAHVFRNSSPRPVEVSETRRWPEAFSVWWYMNCFEEAMTLGGFLVKYTEQFNGSRLKCRNVLGLRIDDMCEEKFVECISSDVFFGLRWSSATGSDQFLKSSQLLMASEGEESQVQCVQENLKCSDFKAESERNAVSGWSYFSAKNLVSSEFEQRYIKVYVGFAGEEIKGVLISSIRSGTAGETHHVLDIDVKEAVKKVSLEYLRELERELGSKVLTKRWSYGVLFEVNQMGLQRIQRRVLLATAAVQSGVQVLNQGASGLRKKIQVPKEFQASISSGFGRLFEDLNCSNKSGVIG
uniref:Uncharacterized protein n=1 Tax=Brassica oleracea var. oleracea TaxID=109376 RepID=A0A0D3DEQ2_BRAOL